MNAVFVLLLILFTLTLASGDLCVWPDFFDISRPDREINKLQVHEISWETDVVTERDPFPSLNWFPSSKTYISIRDNSTLEISLYKGKKRKQSTVYSCFQNFGDNTFLLKSVFTPEQYVCVQLIKRSKYVVQWRKATADANATCEGEFAELSLWPLVYLPLRYPAGDTSILSEDKYLMEYPSCPSLGGFHVRVYDEAGKDVRCRNDNPSSVLDMECIPGEGIRLITGSGSCGFYGFGNRKQAKLHCLGTWDVGKYTFSVLMPNDRLGMNIFHCLRINREDPTSENAIIFLDTICDPSETLKNSYFQLQLRRKNFTSFCDDLSDQCTKASCKSRSMKYWCASTCNICPRASKTVPPAENIQGKWLMQRKGSQDWVYITNDTFTVLGMGTFHAYGGLGSAKKMCLSAPMPLKRDAEQYALARFGDSQGCGPRVTQLRARRVSDSILLLQVAGTAPMMPDKHMILPKQWCNNNYKDSTWFAHIFRPHWPFGNHRKNPPNGFFSLINSETQTPTECMFQNNTVLGPHMEVNITFKEGDATYMCNGESLVMGDEQWSLYFDCGPEAPLNNITFDCLGGYDVNKYFRGIILKQADAESQDERDNLPDQFYCLLLASSGQGSGNLMFLTTAGECDDTYLTMIEWGSREPYIKINVLGEVVIETPTDAAGVVTYSHVISLMLLLVSFLVR